jgi:predicted O-methyltransferase YrrM
MQSTKKHGPGRILALSGGYWQPCALHCGVKLGVFSLLAERRLTAVEAAARLKASPRGVELLLNALTAMDLLDKTEEGFGDTEEARIFLNRESPEYVGYMVMHHHHLVDGWSQLDQAVVSGQPVAKRAHGEERERESFQMGMYNLSMAIAPELAAKINLDGRKRLLDLGGGPGVHAIHFCLANPGLTATIFDRPTTEPFARRTAEKFGMDNRIAFAAGDFLHDPLPAGHDVAWLSQVIHSNSPEQCRQLIARTVAALEPGGLILIHDFLLDDNQAGPLFPALFSLNMLIGNQGRSYSQKEVRQMLADCGVSAITRLDFRGPNDSGVIQGVAP